MGNVHLQCANFRLATSLAAVVFEDCMLTVQLQRFVYFRCSTSRLDQMTKIDPVCLE